MRLTASRFVTAERPVRKHARGGALEPHQDLRPPAGAGEPTFTLRRPGGHDNCPSCAARRVGRAAPWKGSTELLGGDHMGLWVDHGELKGVAGVHAKIHKVVGAGLPSGWLCANGIVMEDLRK